jgi:NADP-dependent 3-hydroxy acid dehydrogenase YdfG
LGIALTQHLSRNTHKVIAVSHNADEYLDKHKDLQVIPFTAHLNVQEDRNRLIAFLKHEHMKIDKLIHNQPFMLKPTGIDDQIDKIGGKIRDEQRKQDRVD